MSGFRRFELLDFPSSSLFYNEVSLYKPHTPLLFPFTDDVEDNLDFALDLLNPAPLPSPLDLFYPLSPPLSPLELFDGAAELPQLERAARRAETELCLRSLNARVAALELGFGRAIGHEMPEPVVDRKYKWTAEIKGPEKEKGFDRTYKLMAEVSGKGEKSLKWTAEMKGKGRDAALSRTYTYQKSTSPGKKAKAKGGEKKDKATETDKKGKKEKAGSESRIVEIEEPASHGAIVLRQAFARRTVNQSKGKKKELSPQDAALIIQMTFRAHLVRRSQVLRGLRDLAVAKAKLKEIRALFYNFSYRRRIVNDAEERQRFSEKIIVLLLTVEAIEGLDFMVRAAKKSMVDELEAMLDVVDPQQYGKLGSLKRRQFDLPVGGTISKEMARDVAGVVQMLDEDWGSA